MQLNVALSEAVARAARERSEQERETPRNSPEGQGVIRCPAPRQPHRASVPLLVTPNVGPAESSRSCPPRHAPLHGGNPDLPSVPVTQGAAVQRAAVRACHDGAHLVAFYEHFYVTVAISSIVVSSHVVVFGGGIAREPSSEGRHPYSTLKSLLHGTRQVVLAAVMGCNNYRA